MPMLSQEDVLEAITQELVAKYDCHTVILYGSRARGDATEASDYDLLGIRAAGSSARDARLWNGVYLDLFIYPESALADPHPGMLDMRHGRVLREKESTAQNFFAKLEKIHARGPKKLKADDINALRVWHRKAVDRIRLGGIQGDLRRAELLPALLEHYFTTRGVWYRGPKASFSWFKQHRFDLYQAFEKALKPGSDLQSIQSLVDKIDLEIECEAAPAAESTANVQGAVRMTPMSETGFQEFKQRSIEELARMRAQEFSRPVESTRADAEREFKEHLPLGQATPEHFFYAAADEAGHSLGYLWYGLREKGGRKRVFIFDLFVNEEARGKSCGKQMLTWLETETNKLGLDEITLHVVGTNKIARGLYSSLGYETTNLYMSKKL